jgi:dihydroflavonol-4-reductase
MKVMVTGGTGRMGNVLVRRLVQDRHDVVVLTGPNKEMHKSLEGLDVEFIEGDIRDPEAVRKATKGAERVYHLATKLKLAPDKDKSIWETNVGGTANVIAACKAEGVDRLIHCSSHHAYKQEPLDIPLDENRELALNHVCAYHKSKAHAELLVRKEIEGGMNAIIVSPGTMIGPHDYEPSLFGRAFIDLYMGRIPAIMDGITDYIHTEDVINGVIAAADKAPAGERYLLSGDMLTMREVVEMVREWSPHKVTNTFLPIWFMSAIAPAVGFAARIQGKEPVFTKEMIIAAISNKKILYGKAQKELGFTVRDLKGTFREMLDWYQARDLLR